MNMSGLNIRNNDLQKTCRLCLAKNTILVNIHSFSDEIKSKISDAVMKCAPVQITIDDKLPNGVCSPCYQQLIAFSEFQKKIISSHETLYLYLQKLEHRDFHNVDILKSPPDIKTELLDITVKCEDVSDDSSEQPNNNDIDDSKIDLLNVMVLDDEKNCQPSNDQKCFLTKNSGFCTIDNVNQGEVDTDGLINEYSDVDGIDISKTKGCLRNTLDEDLKKSDPTELMPNMSMDDVVNKFCLSYTGLNENIEIPDQYNHHRKTFSKKCNDDMNLIHQCNVCDKRFSRLSHLINHKRIHTGEKPYKCDWCETSFSTSSNLTKHKRIHTSERRYKCDLCSKSFFQLSYLTSHKRFHTGEKPYKCDLCDISFSTSSNLNTHKRTHTGEKPYNCGLCKKSFSHTSSLICHKRTHTGEKPYKCDFCERSFSERTSLIWHKRSHTGEKPYKCDLCDKSFSQGSTLIGHKRTHTGEKPYKCDICNTSFSRLSILVTHKRTHTGEKPYNCDYCNKSFSQLSHLVVHKRSHTSEKPYKCDLCDTGFSASSNLIKHRRIHTGVKPYKCDICNKMFSDRSALVRHKRIHTKEKP